jgi:transposase
METAPLWIGIDVAKQQLDIAIGSTGDTWTVTNDETGIEALLADLRDRNCVVVLEATGGFEVNAVSLRRSCSCAQRPLRGSRRRRAAQPRDSHLLPASARTGEATHGRPHCMRSQTTHDPQLDGTYR